MTDPGHHLDDLEERAIVQSLRTVRQMDRSYRFWFWFYGLPMPARIALELLALFWTLTLPGIALGYLAGRII